MIDIKKLEDTEYLNRYQKDLANRGMDPQLVTRLLELNQARKKVISEKENLRAHQNKVGEEIAKKKKAKEDATDLLSEMQMVSQKIKDFDVQVESSEQALREQLSHLPNHLHPEVVKGLSEHDNVEVRRIGEPRHFEFTPKDHVDLGEALGILDFGRGAKVAGARFTFLKGAAAQLERALIQFKLDLHSRSHGYQEMIPPFAANSNSFFGVGQFPKFKEDVFHLENTDYYMIPTAEVPVTNYFAEEILDEKILPQKFAAYSPCFRSEAGSYGRDTRGLIRQHQFNKVELVIFSRPEESYEMHEQLVSHAERVLKILELPYRVMSLCSKDISFSAAKCYDLEVWLPGQSAYREISSCSNFEDFQARRANIRFRSGEKGKPQFVHTLNGSGLAIGRTLVAILENYQREDGSIEVPEALRPYMGGQIEILGPH